MTFLDSILSAGQPAIIVVVLGILAVIFFISNRNASAGDIVETPGDDEKESEKDEETSDADKKMEETLVSTPESNPGATSSKKEKKRKKKRRKIRYHKAKSSVVAIRVEDVCMEFKVATYNTSGLKEFLIRTFKRQMSYRSLMALDHISFEVKKGEVVGIIGTNGSGKSTLLKIVSGALDPTDGEVIVDFGKIQLLTLGTGFDLELTGRENVYLNGAIIGYPEEFLEAHYQEIVDFAELEGFMEEKVKNYSSGMMSRLAFAIATAGKAADILILDEVLSVGDVFFQKKSLARVKEMIHGGSTVLIVSHSMETIVEHCDRVIWIEKGKLLMDGDPREVCRAYEEMGRQ